MNLGESHETSLLGTLEGVSRLVVSHTGDPGETLTNIARLIQKRFQSDVCSVYLMEADQGHLVLAATIGLAPSSVGKVRMQLNEGLVGLVAELIEPQVVADATLHPRFKYFPEAGEDQYHSFLGVPIVDRTLLVGVLVVQTIDPRDFSRDEVRMIATAASQLAPIVGDARITQEAQAQADRLKTAHEATEAARTIAGTCLGQLRALRDAAGSTLSADLLSAVDRTIQNASAQLDALGRSEITAGRGGSARLKTRDDRRPAPRRR